MTAYTRRDAHDGSTHECGIDLTGQGDYPSAAVGGWDSCREAEWLAFCADVDATAAADEIRYPSGSSMSGTTDRDS
jgi:hypothetical protein